MVHKQFDEKTKALFNETRKIIAILSGKLLSTKLKPKEKEQLIKKRNTLREKSRELKAKYYQFSTLMVLNESEALLRRMEKIKNEKGKIFAYVRVSSTSQNIDSQLILLNESKFAIDKIYQDKESGGNLDRIGFQNLMEILHEGDWLIVTAIDRVGRSLSDFVNIISLFEEKNTFCFIKRRFRFFNVHGKIVTSWNSFNGRT